MKIPKAEIGFLKKNDLVLHGDLHTNGIVIKNNEAFLIDGEFSHSGNIAFDIGMLLANIVIDLNIAGIYHDRYVDEILNLFINKLKLDSSEEITIVLLYELIRQNIGASFSVPVSVKEARENLYKYAEELKNDLCDYSVL